jgi:hypothetical protein
MKKILLTLFCALSSLMSFAQLENVERQLIVVPNKGQESEMIEFVNSSGSTIVQRYEQLNWYLIQIPSAFTQESFQGVLKSKPFCQNVYKDEVMEYNRDYVPSDPNFNLAWHLKQSSDKDIDADEAWDLVSNNGGYTTVAVFDGGFDPSHEDFTTGWNNIFNAVTNLPFNGAFVNSFDRHGIACAGTISAVTNNGIGVAGVGNNLVQVMPVNIMASVSSGGSFSTSASIQINGINAAMSNPTCVAISMSYSGSSFSQALSDAFTMARTTARDGKGILCFASSGNGYSGTATNYPAWYSSVWGVGATNSSDLKSGFSNFGQICDISAPGSSIITTDRVGSDGYSTTSNYATVSGTSFSCPITAGCAALVAYRNSSLTADQIMALLAQSCEKVGGYTYSNDPNFPYSTRSNELGYGRVNIKNAILLTEDNGGGTPPPITNHDLMISNLSVSPQSGFYGSNITISCTQMTMMPNLSSVNSVLEYRYSSNTTWGDSDDIVIGTDTTTLGGGILSGIENITFVVPSIPGTKYILVKANSNNAIVETTYANNTSQVSFSPIDPNVALSDLSLELVQPTSSFLLTATQVAINFRWRVTNTGTTTVTSFNWERRWVNCTSTGFNFQCVSTSSWTGTLLPGQSVVLPSSNGFISVNTCPQLMGTGSSVCFVPAGGSNIYRTSILNVNGSSSGDYNLSNNVVDCNLSRLNASEEGLNISSVDPTYIEIYTVTGMLLDKAKWEELPSGIYLIKEVYPDETRVVKKFK